MSVYGKTWETKGQMPVVYILYLHNIIWHNIICLMISLRNSVKTKNYTVPANFSLFETHWVFMYFQGGDIYIYVRVYSSPAPVFLLSIHPALEIVSAWTSAGHWLGLCSASMQPPLALCFHSCPNLLLSGAWTERVMAVTRPVCPQLALGWVGAETCSVLSWHLVSEALLESHSGFDIAPGLTVILVSWRFNVKSECNTYNVNGWFSLGAQNIFVLPYI